MIRAIIIDDEQGGVRALEQKLTPYAAVLQVVGIFRSPYDAAKQVAGLEPDVVFLDVEMPGMNGFQFLQSLGQFEFEVIFTTGHNRYTLEALRINALDYLLKPIVEEELNAAILRLQKRLPEKTQLKSSPLQRTPTNARLALPTAEGIFLVRKTDIIRVEAMSNYSTFHLVGNKKIVVSKTLKEFENALNDPSFLRVNRSAIANLDYALKYRKGDGGTLHMSDGIELEVSPQRKDELLQRLFND